MFSSNNKKFKALSKADVTSGLSRRKYEAAYNHLLPELQARFPENEDPTALFRVLAEWEGNIDIAEKKYRETQEWRKTHLPISKDEVQASLNTGKFFVHGFDRVGRPVVYFRTALHDPKQFTPEQTMRMVVHETENLMERIRTDPRYANVEEVLVLVDRTDATMKNTDIEFQKQFYQTMKDHYPSIAEVFVIYNVNMVFRTMWSMLKPFLDLKSQGRTHLVNTRAELYDFIAEDQLADFLGGTNVYDPTVNGVNADGQPEAKHSEAIM